MLAVIKYRWLRVGLAYISQKLVQEFELIVRRKDSTTPTKA